MLSAFSSRLNHTLLNLSLPGPVLQQIQTDEIKLAGAQGPDNLAPRTAVRALHRDKGLSVLVVNFVDRTDVGMIQRGGGLSFTLEAAKGLRVFGDLVRKGT